MQLPGIWLILLGLLVTGLLVAKFVPDSDKSVSKQDITHTTAG